MKEKTFDLSNFLANIKKLEIVASKNAYSILTGDYNTAIPGRGMDFHEARKYVIGESIRHIDWNMTARLGEPYIKIFTEERMREVFIALDVSSSMYAGWQKKTKIEFATELASTIGYSAILSKDKLGCILFNDTAIEVIEPGTGKKHLFNVLKRFYEISLKEPAKKSGTDIRAAIHAIQKFRGKRFIVFMISDFLDRDIPEDLKYIKNRHDINMLHIYDPLEYTNQKFLRFPVYSPEKDNSKGIFRIDKISDLEASTKFLKQEFLKYRIIYESISTIEDLDKKLREYFLIKKRVHF
ncbi:MAG: DUF58 domain-containing protein [Leptospiraceae bacterium]|nr:DUF58 domain-containing protein [Leptospiraceae bacterium]MCK6380729.1 DUF58 domain-containing protein [Leptospiraceae bacterium]NUM40290.1 DUF58 domain-containing protein [Leptospiraceae bacterium]